MVRVLGNSSERVPLPDLHDIVYYRQIKEYTDQEYEASKDLKRELSRGRLILLEKTDPIKGDARVENKLVAQPNELKAVVREIFSELRGSVTNVVQEVAPVVAEIVRQELSRLPIQQGSVQSANPTSFRTEEYIPTVTTEGMVSNIEAKETEISGNETDAALKALRSLDKTNK